MRWGTGRPFSCWMNQLTKKQKSKAKANHSPYQLFYEKCGQWDKIQCNNLTTMKINGLRSTSRFIEGRLYYIVALFGLMVNSPESGIRFTHSQNRRKYARWKSKTFISFDGRVESVHFLFPFSSIAHFLSISFIHYISSGMLVYVYVHHIPFICKR